MIRIALVSVLVSIFVYQGKAVNIDSLKQYLPIKDSDDFIQKEEAIFEILDYYNKGNGKNHDSLYYYAAILESKAKEWNDQVLEADAGYYMARSLFSKKPEQTFLKLRECIDTYKDVGDDFKTGKAYYRIGYYHEKVGEYDTRVNLTLKAIPYLEKSDAEKKEHYLFNCYIGLFSAYMNKGAFAEAMDAILIAEKMAKESGVKKRQLSAATNLAALYGNLSLESSGYGTVEERKQYTSLLLEYSLEAYRLAQEIDAPKSICTMSFNIGLYYSEEEDWANSNDYLQRSLAIAKEYDFYRDIFSAYDILGDNYREMNMPDSSDYCVYQAYEAAQKTHSSDIKIKAEYTIVDLLIGRKQHQSAIDKAESALELSVQTNHKRRQQTGYAYLYELHKEIGQTEKALVYLEKFHEIKDELVSEQTLDDIEALKNKYEQEKNEKEIAQLKEQQLSQKLSFQKKLAIVAITAFLALLSAMYVFFRERNKNLQEQRKAIELEQRLLRSQMNPHFTFNALSSIQTYLLKSGKVQKGAYYLAKFAKLMRQILSQSRTSFISIEEEIQTLENYLSLQKLRYDDNFQYEIDVEHSIGKGITLIPPMMIQPILENAIEHGKVYTLDEGKITVEIYKESDFLIVDIKDNGLGRKNTIESRAKEHESVALGIIEDRLAILRKDYNKAAGMEISDPEEGGTRVVFKLPFIQQ